MGRIRDRIYRREGTDLASLPPSGFIYFLAI